MIWEITTEEAHIIKDTLIKGLKAQINEMKNEQVINWLIDDAKTTGILARLIEEVEYLSEGKELY